MLVAVVAVVWLWLASCKERPGLLGMRPCVVRVLRSRDELPIERAPCSGRRSGVGVEGRGLRVGR